MEEFYYSNDLNLENFIHMLDDPTECYKFYWMDSILSLLSEGKTVIEFSEIIDGMIADAWYSVSEYHLHLGPRDMNGNTVNSLERAINKLMYVSSMKSTASRDELIKEIKCNEQLLYDDKYQISKNVPYRLLSSFLKELGGNDRLWDQTQRLIAYLEIKYQKECLPYKIKNAAGLKKTVMINPYWVNLLIDNMVIIRSWIQLKKVKYLQNRNPGVPGVIYKLEPENEKLRKLKNIRELWLMVMEQEVVYDIYCENRIDIKNYEMDHFVPWSYVVNDEIWNLMPMVSSLNSSKSNKLPNWNEYFLKFANNQYQLYKNIQEHEIINKKFQSCKRDNVISIWANEELYVPGNTKAVFAEVLEKNLKPIYDAARIQGYMIWNTDAFVIGKSDSIIS